MGRTNRDDFKPSVVENLAKRVAYHCSICRTSTIGPSASSEKAAHMGKAAHIVAAAPGGPRPDPTMTAEERSAITNGIWLCSNCATLIDVDVVEYSAERLHELKRQAEDAARVDRGSRMPERDDAKVAVQGALTGTAPKFTRGAITSTHAAVQQLLRDMDPRLSVETSYVGGTVRYGIRARENVDFQLRIPMALRDQWRSGMAELHDHGSEVRLPTAGVKVTGSPLFDFLLDTNALADAHLTIGPSSKRMAVEKLRLTDPNTGAIEQFDDIHGSIASGRKSGTFEGQACGGAMSTSLRLEPGEGASPWKTTFGLALHFDCWEGIDVNALPYFEKLCSLIQRLRAGWEIEIELEIDGQSIGRARGSLGDLGALNSIAGLLEYVSAVRAIAAHLGSRVEFRCDSTISNSAFEEACDVRDRIDGKRMFGPEVGSVRMTLTASRDNVQRFLNPEVAVVRVVGDGQEMKAFGQSLSLPRTAIDIMNFQARIADESIQLAALKDGDGVPIELLPANGFRLAERYLRPDEPAEPDESA